MSTPLSDIRMLTGLNTGMKGLPPTIIAPMLNILNLLDSHLIHTGFYATLPIEIEKEQIRLSQALILMNADDSDDDDDSSTDDDDLMEEDPFEFPEDDDDEED